MPEIELKKWTTLASILSWNCPKGETASIRVYRDASFELFGEGTFIAALQALRSSAGRIEVLLNYEMTGALAAPAHDSVWPDLFNGLGGAALIHIADKITSPSGQDLTEQLQEISWVERILKNQGVIGDGKRQSIICRNPGTPVPRCLREGSEITIPSRLQFEKLLRKLGGGLGASSVRSENCFLDSVTEDELSGFLFEAFRNAIEHRPDNCPPGVWGVTIDKVLLNEEPEIRSRQQIPAVLRPHLEAAWKDGRRSKGMFVLCVTVCDYGPGIQNTLPALPWEIGWDRLLRAFKRGVSRKPKSGSPDWGQGLPNILDTAKGLRALLFVRSAGEAAIADGGSIDPQWTRLVGPGFSAEHIAGTSLSVIWVVTDENPDQATFDF